jgi:signal peptidase I
MAAVIWVGPIAPLAEMASRLGAAVQAVFIKTGGDKPDPMGKVLVLAGLLIVGSLAVQSSIARYLTTSLTVPNGDMYPTLETGDYAVIDKTSFGATLPFAGKVSSVAPRIGDLVAYDNPDKPDELTFGRVLMIGPGSFSLTAGAPPGVERRPVEGECSVVEPDRVNNKIATLPCQRFEERAGNRVWQTAQPAGVEMKPGETREVPAGGLVVGQDFRRGERPWRIVKAEALAGQPIMIWLSTAGPAGGVRWHRVGKRLP